MTRPCALSPGLVAKVATLVTGGEPVGEDVVGDDLTRAARGHARRPGPGEGAGDVDGVADDGLAPHDAVDLPGRQCVCGHRRRRRRAAAAAGASAANGSACATPPRPATASATTPTTATMLRIHRVDVRACMLCPLFPGCLAAAISECPAVTVLLPRETRFPPVHGRTGPTQSSSYVNATGPFVVLALR